MGELVKLKTIKEKLNIWNRENKYRNWISFFHERISISWDGRLNNYFVFTSIRLIIKRVIRGMMQRME